jgi:hypothetical protein
MTTRCLGPQAINKRRRTIKKILHILTFYENAAECPVLWTGMNAAVLKFDRQDILVLHCIFAEAGKPRLSVKPRLVGGELHCWY